MFCSQMWESRSHWLCQILFFLFTIISTHQICLTVWDDRDNCYGSNSPPSAWFEAFHSIGNPCLSYLRLQLFKGYMKDHIIVTLLNWYSISLLLNISFYTKKTPQKLLLNIIRKVHFTDDICECRDVQQHKIMEASERQVFSHELRHSYHPVNVLGIFCKTWQTLRVCRS